MGVNDSTKKQHIPNRQLREARLQRGWTHKDVADRINLPDSHSVGRWERGENMPSSLYRQELCRIFNKSLEELGLLMAHPYEDEQTPIQTDHSRRTEIYAQIPPAFTSFVGREQEVAAVCDLLTRSHVRLLTLLGSGGIGKTRLSMQVGMQMRSYFADGICFVPLVTLSDPTRVLPALADALSIESRQELSLASQVKTVLQEKHLLLILDNFEHVMAAAPFIEDLLGHCPHVKVLVTSRAVLHLSAEQEFPLSPLLVPDLKQVSALVEPEEQLRYAAVDLFVQRARAVQPTFQVTPGNVDAVAALCVRLDGLPLAIELAAARIKYFSPQVLLSRLSSVLHSLKNHQIAPSERHHTLYQTIKWSYDLLTSREQWLFRHLSIFIGGATLQAIEDLFSLNGQQPVDCLELVESLVDKSLLQSTGQESDEPRFVMLEMIREYGLECLQNGGELEESRRAYALYFHARMVEAEPHLRGEQQVAWLSRLERDVDNLHAALGWLIEQRETERALYFCEAYGKFCGLRGYWSEEQRCLHAVLALPHTPEQRTIRAKVLRRAGHLAYRLRRLLEARALLEESIHCSREVGDYQNLAGASGGLGRVLYRLNDVPAAARLLRESVEAARLSNDRWSLANALESLGKFLYDQGENHDARALLEESVAIARTLVDTESLARILTTLVKLEITDGNLVRAETLSQESFTLAQQLGTRPLLALALDSLGDVAFFEGKYEQARLRFELRIAMARELGDTPTVASRLLKVADIALLQKDLAQAAEYYREALRLHKEAGDTSNIGRCLTGFVHIMLDQGQTERAAYLFGFATTLLHSSASLPPIQHPDYERIDEKMQTLLSEAQFAQVRHQGQSASLEEIMAVIDGVACKA